MKDAKYQLNETDWWCEEIPCLHRVYKTAPIQGAHKIQKKLGMTISLSSLEKKLMALSNKVKELNYKYNLKKKALLTFDDGHKDVLLSIPLLKKFPDIQPVLFMTGRQFNGEVIPLPLTALYTWCDRNNRDPNKLMEDFGFDRLSLKLLPENEQRQRLEDAGIDINPQEEEMLNLKDLDYLNNCDWLIGYHGNYHCDLRIHRAVDIEDDFKRDLRLLLSIGYVPWIAWPEGCWNKDLYLMAERLGFTMQFGLSSKKYEGKELKMLNRVIWK